MSECELCEGLGWYGDNGPGILGNSEFVQCDCGVTDMCKAGCHPYEVHGGIPWCAECNKQADMSICRYHNLADLIGYGEPDKEPSDCPHDVDPEREPCIKCPKMQDCIGMATPEKEEE